MDVCVHECNSACLPSENPSRQIDIAQVLSVNSGKPAVEATKQCPLPDFYICKHGCKGFCPLHQFIGLFLMWQKPPAMQSNLGKAVELPPIKFFAHNSLYCEVTDEYIKLNNPQ